MVLGLGVAVLVFYVWQQLYLTQAGYRIDKLKEEIIQTESEVNDLKSQIKALTSLENLAGFGREEGLMVPSPRQVVFVTEPNLPVKDDAVTLRGGWQNVANRQPLGWVEEAEAR